MTERPWSRWASGSGCTSPTCSPRTSNRACVTTLPGWRKRCVALSSYAAEIRRQLASEAGSGSRRTRRSELAGLIDAAGRPDPGGLVFHTQSAAVARSVVRLWRREFGLYPKLSPIEPDSFGRSRYLVRVDGEEARQAAEELRATRGSKSEADRIAYLKGSFQGAGSITRPGRGHHLEFVHRDEKFVVRLVEISRFPLKVIRRKDRWVAYTKSADGVTTLLSQMGLHDAVLDYEARAVLGEAKANANRVTNFDSANAGRTARAALRQQEALENLDPEKLPAALREMLELRLEYPDASLAELALLGGVSRSAVNHRLRRLVALGDGDRSDIFRAGT